VAAVIEQETGAETELVEGGRGEFTVWVAGQKVAGKTTEGFPTEQQVLAAVRQALKS
jgi:hypothetical protein